MLLGTGVLDAKTMATNSTSSRPKQRQHIVLLSTGASLRSQNNNNNKSNFLALGHLRSQNNDNKYYFLALRHHFDTKTTATNRTSWHWGITSTPKQRQQIVLFSTGASCRGQNNGNKSYFLAFGHHFEAKTTATNRTS